MMYGKSGAADPYADAAPAQPTTKPTAEPEEEKSEEATAVIPKELLGGKDFKPGEEIMLEIVQLTEDGAVVKYSEGKGEEEHEEEPASPQAAAPTPGDSGMASMMQ